jgi:hypothetical protein
MKNTDTKPDSKNNVPQVILTPLKAALIAGHAQKLYVPIPPKLDTHSA